MTRLRPLLTLIATIIVVALYNAAPANAALISDMRWSGPTATYTIASTSLPSPWADGLIQGSSSTATIYTVATKQAGWPDPYSWSSYAAAFSSNYSGTTYSDNNAHPARVQVDVGPYGNFDLWFGWAVYIPTSTAATWPDWTTSGGNAWFVAQEVMGPPDNGSPAVAADILKTGGQLYLYGADPWAAVTEWKTAITPGTWVRVVQHIVFSKYAVQTGSTNPGLLQVWVNGTPQKFLGVPSTTHQQPNYNAGGAWISPDGYTLHEATVMNDTTNNYFYLNNYRLGYTAGVSSPFPSGNVTIFHAGLKVGTTYADVAPTATS